MRGIYFSKPSKKIHDKPQKEQFLQRILMDPLEIDLREEILYWRCNWINVLPPYFRFTIQQLILNKHKTHSKFNKNE